MKYKKKKREYLASWPERWKVLSLSLCASVLLSDILEKATPNARICPHPHPPPPGEYLMEQFAVLCKLVLIIFAVLRI